MDERVFGRSLPTNMDTREFVLERLRYAVQKAVAEETFCNMDLTPEVLVDDIGRTLVLQVMYNVMGKYGPPDTVSYPTTWKDAVRAELYRRLQQQGRRRKISQWLGRVLADRWPIGYTTHTFTTAVVFPDVAPPPLGEFKRRYMVFDQGTLQQRLHAPLDMAP